MQRSQLMPVNDVAKVLSPILDHCQDSSDICFLQKCELLESRDLFCFLRHYILGTKNNTWHMVGGLTVFIGGTISSSQFYWFS